MIPTRSIHPRANQPFRWRTLLIGALAGAVLSAHGATWDLSVATADPENTIEDGVPTHTAVAFTAGGAVLTPVLGAQPSLLTVSLGHSFAGRAYHPAMKEDLLLQADTAYQAGSAFLSVDGVIDRGYLQDPAGSGNTALLDNNYNGDALDAAEADYIRVLAADPFEESAALGILRVRQAKVHRLHLLADDARRRVLRARLTMVDMTGPEILAEELALLDSISDYEREVIALLFEVFRDPVFRGAGALLRGEYSAEEMDAVHDTFDMFFNAGRRFAEAELDIVQRAMLLNFFDEFERGAALARLADAQAYVVEAIRLLNPYAQQTVGETSDATRLSSILDTMRQFQNRIGQGYNPFGFLPDFVPFSATNSDANNLSTFTKMLDLATTATNQASTLEDTARSSQEEQEIEEHQYATALNEIQTSYEQRIKTLVGTVEIDGVQVPDMLTFMLPDIDIDGDGSTERDTERMLIEASEGHTFGGKGRIAQQYSQIINAELRVEQALNALSNNLKEIEIREQTAQAILGIYEEIAELIMENGARVKVLIQEKGRLQKEAQKNIARKQKNSTIWGKLGFKKSAPTRPRNDEKWVGTALTVGNYVYGQYAAVSASNLAASVSSIQGQLAQDVANIDAQISEIQYMERAQIELARGRQELLRTEQEVKVLILKQANLALDISMAQRDATREMLALTDLIDEINGLATDYIRAVQLASNDPSVDGWSDQDVRLVLTSKVMMADHAFERAQTWCYIALRALEYYGNRPPDSEGRPNALVRTLYAQLYEARNAAHLLQGSVDSGSGLLFNMQALATTDFLFSADTVECPDRGVLSLKYDIYAPTVVTYSSATGNPIAGGVDSEADYRYMDPSSGEIYEGARAYQAAFRAALRAGLRGQRPNRILTLSFATDLFRRVPAQDESAVVGNNPFGIDVESAKIVGFQPANCAGQGVRPNTQGIQLNFTGGFDGLDQQPVIRIAQRGNSYLKHSEWIIETDPDSGALSIADPWKSITVYSAYEQLMPTWLIGDIGAGTGEEETIGSDVEAELAPLINGQNFGTKVTVKTNKFTDRAVANDRWELLISDFTAGANIGFLDEIENMLDSPVPASPATDFITDVQLWIGWAYR